MSNGISSFLPEDGSAMSFDTDNRAITIDLSSIDVEEARALVMDSVGILRAHGDPDRKVYGTERNLYDPERRALVIEQLPEALAMAGWALSEGLQDKWGLTNLVEPSMVYTVNGAPLVATPYIEARSDIINLPFPAIREEAQKTVHQYVQALRSPNNKTDKRAIAMILPRALAMAGWRMTESQKRELGISDLPAIRPNAIYLVNSEYIPTTKYPMFQPA